MAGVGPAVTESKSVALPLGYIPEQKNASQTRPIRVGYRDTRKII